MNVLLLLHNICCHHSIFRNLLCHQNSLLLLNFLRDLVQIKVWYFTVIKWVFTFIWNKHVLIVNFWIRRFSHCCCWYTSWGISEGDAVMAGGICLLSSVAIIKSVLLVLDPFQRHILFTVQVTTHSIGHT